MNNKSLSRKKFSVLELSIVLFKVFFWGHALKSMESMELIARKVCYDILKTFKKYQLLNKQSKETPEYHTTFINITQNSS